MILELTGLVYDICGNFAVLALFCYVCCRLLGMTDVLIMICIRVVQLGGALALYCRVSTVFAPRVVVRSMVLEPCSRGPCERMGVVLGGYAV